jgi:hypothetical protein
VSEYKKDDSEVGALWEKSSARGIYMTGMINGQPVVLFKNDRKVAGSKQPDWRVLKSKPKGERTVGADDEIGF